MKRRNDSFIVYYRCNCCNGEVTVPRQKGRRRGEGHIKDLWCPYCKAAEKFVEVGMY